MHDPQLGQSGKENRICLCEQAPSFSPCQQYMHREHSDLCTPSGVHWGTWWGQDKSVFARICSRLQPSFPEEPLKCSQMWIYLITASSEVARRLVHSPHSFTVSVSSRTDESGSHMLVVISAECPPATWHPERSDCCRVSRVAVQPIALNRARNQTRKLLHVSL